MMKQNHKKIKIYSESLCASANTFENFQSIKGSLEDLIVLSKQDLTINTFLKSKLIDSSQKMDVFRKAFNEAFNKELLDILKNIVKIDTCYPPGSSKLFSNYVKKYLNKSRLKIKSFGVDKEKINIK